VSFNSVLLNGKHNAHKNIAGKGPKTQDSDSDEEMNEDEQMESDESDEMVETPTKHTTKSSPAIRIINEG